MPDGWITILFLIAASTLVLMAAITFVPAMLVKRGCRAELLRRSRGRLALTFDDGPGKNMTRPLLELLRAHGVKASFFLVGFRAEDAPTMCQSMAEAGHELGCHTQMHKKPWQVLPWTAVRDLNEGYESMKRWMPASAPFRPPFGKLTTWTWLAARRRGAILCFWTHDGGDTHATLPDPAHIVQQIIQSGGGVVLLHSHDRGEERQRYVLAITDQLLVAAREHGLQVCTMSDLFDEPVTVPTLVTQGGAHGNAA